MPELTVEPAEQVPADARVHHVDELDEAAQTRLHALLEGSAEGVAVEEATLDAGDVVKFTDYYEVRQRC